MTPRLRLWLWLLLVGALLATSSRLHRTDDLSRLLPASGALGTAARAALQGRLADVVLIEVDGTGQDRRALTDAVAAVEAAANETGLFERVRGRIDPLRDGTSVREVALHHAIALLPEETLRQRTSEEGVEKALRGWQARLLGPAGGLAARGLVADPLDLGGLALDRLRGASGPWRIRPESGLLLDADGSRALVVATPRRTALAAAEDASLARQMDALAAASPLPARWFGGPRVATDMADAIRRDTTIAGASSLLALLAVLAVGFRSARPLLGLALPLLGTAAAIGAALAIRSPIHGISLGFGGALLGIAVDYWIHLHVAAAARYDGPDPQRRLAAATEAWRQIRGPLAMSAASTVAAFALLLGSRFPVVRDLGASGIAAIAGAAVGTALIGPILYARLGGRASAGRIGEPPRAAAIALLAATALLGLAALRVTFDGDPRHLVAVSPQTRTLERELAERYGGIGTGGIVAVPGTDPDRVLDLVDEVTRALGEVPGTTVSGPSALIPGPATVRARKAALPPPEVLRARVEAAATAAGLDPAALLPAVDAYAQQTAPTAADWAATPLAEGLDRMLGPEGATLEVVLADPDLAELAERRMPAGATLVVPTALAADGVAEIRDDLVRLGGIAALAALLLLAARYRSARHALAAATPVAAAVLCTLGAMGLLGWPLDAVSTSVLVLIVGLAFDYGVFLADDPAHATSVTLAAATSIAGFGPLALSRSPGLAGAGLVVSVGLGAAALAAVLLTPRIIRGTLLGPLWRPSLASGARLGALAALHLQVLLLLRFVVAPPEIEIGAVPEGEPPPTDDRRLGPHRLVRRHDVWTLSVSGSHAEMGAAHGRLTRDLREHLEDELFSTFARAVPNPLSQAAIVEGVMIAGAGLDAHVDPRWRRELAGLAASTPDPRWWLLPVYTRKLYFHALHDIGQALVDSPLVACTGLLATGEATSDGHTLLARTFDFEGGPAFDTDKVVIVRRPDRGLATVSIAFPGMIGVVSGINERHIALALQAAGSDARPRMAEPMAFVLRRALEEAASLDDVARILDEGRGFGTELVLAADGIRGETALFEVTPDRVVRLPTGPLRGVSNHLRSPELAQDAENQRRIAEQTTARRLARVEELLEARRGTLDLPAAVEILRDRAAPGGAPLPRGHRWAIDADIASHAVAFDVTEGLLWVSVAPNLSGGFVSYRLDDLLRGEIEPELAAERSDVAAALRTHRGRALLREAQHARRSEAEALLREALRYLPDHPEPLIALAGVVRDPTEARTWLDRAEAAPPEDARDRDRIEALRARIDP